ncbi:hypothetical protein BH23VER1_BH23VER1_18630 [soil metagenome]
MPPLPIRLLAFALTGALFTPLAPAQESWPVETYQVPGMEHGFTSRERGFVKPPPVPSNDAPEEEISEFIKQSDSFVRHYLEAQGLPVPKGALLAFDPVSATLAARLPENAQASIAALARNAAVRAPRCLRFDLLIFEAAAPEIREIMAEASHSLNNQPLLESLLAQAEAGQAKLVAEARAETKSGQRVKVSSTDDATYPIDLGMTTNGWVEFGTDASISGCILEIDPVVGPDGYVIDLNLSLDYQFAPSGTREEATLITQDTIIRTPIRDVTEARIRTSTAMVSGSAKLVGVWTPASEGGQPGEGSDLQAAFLSGAVVVIMPNAIPILAEWLEIYGNAIVEIPPGEPVYDQPDGDLPPGMIVRRFPTSPHFFQSLLNSLDADEPGAADPFAAEPEAPGLRAREPRFTVEATVQDILKAAGISFPEGASANYLMATGELVVRNLPQHIDLLEEYIEEIYYDYEILTVALTSHVVEAPAVLLRQLARETMAQSDHTAAWEAVEAAAAEGRATILRSQWLDTKSGQRASIDAGRDHTYLIEAFVAPVATTSHSSKDKEAVASATASAGSVLTFSHETRRVGFKLELDPVLGPDGRTIDLNLTTGYHFAAPERAGPRTTGADLDPLLDPGTTTFFEAGGSTSTTTLSGTTRMIGLWPPKNLEREGAEDVLQAHFLRSDIVRGAPIQAGE